MKRWLILLTLAVAVLIITYPMAADNQLAVADDALAVVFLPIESDVDVCETVAGMKVLRLGLNELEGFMAKHSDYYGISIAIECDKKLRDKFYEKYRVCQVSKQNIESINIEYGYSVAFGRSVRLGGYDVNVQTAYKDGVLTIGIPLILGSY